MLVNVLFCALLMFQDQTSKVNFDREMIAEVLADYRATFVLHDLQSEHNYIFNPLLAAERLSPCSTFKIPNAAIGIETGVLSGPEHKFKWDGRERWNKNWNRDHSLHSAIQVSAVWYFQELARQIGENTMQRYVDALDYGNRDIDSGLDTFWLNGSIEISAMEQIAFLRKLYLNTLPLKDKTMRQVREMLVLERGDAGVFSGKTGTGWDPVREELTHGWFVGHVATIHGNYVFALNIQDGPKPWGLGAKAMLRQLLDRLGVLPLSVGSEVKTAG